MFLVRFTCLFGTMRHVVFFYLPAVNTVNEFHLRRERKDLHYLVVHKVEVLWQIITVMELKQTIPVLEFYALIKRCCQWQLFLHYKAHDLFVFYFLKLIFHDFQPYSPNI